jgi:hypothetical protein
MLNVLTDAVDPFPPSGALLVVSPHLDDAVFSCAAILGRGEPVEVLTVFAGEPQPPRQGWWDEVCGFASSAESVPARRLEDERALAPQGHVRSYLDLLELQHFDGPRPAEDAGRIARAVQEWLTGKDGGTVALPAGAGWAPYWLPTRIAKRLREPRGDASVILYEEIPYLWGGGADRAAKRAGAEHGYRVRLEVVPVDREAKARRIAAYASQIPHISPAEGRLDSPAVLPATERYWWLRRR